MDSLLRSLSHSVSSVWLTCRCIIDRKQRTFDAESCRVLCNFAEVVVREIEKNEARVTCLIAFAAYTRHQHHVVATDRSLVCATALHDTPTQAIGCWCPHVSLTIQHTDRSSVLLSNSLHSCKYVIQSLILNKCQCKRPQLRCSCRAQTLLARNCRNTDRY